MPQIDETLTSPHQSGRNGKTPQLIVCHICDGTYEGTKAWFTNSASVTSSHYIVSQNGRICQCVPLEKAAWCNGTSMDARDAKYAAYSTVPLVIRLGGNANEYSVSIECEGFYRKTLGKLATPQLSALAWLIGHIQSEVKRVYGHDIPLTREHVVGHCEITPKTKPNCPGQEFQWDELMALLRVGSGSGKAPLYRVQVGAFNVRANAENMLDKLKAQGFDGFIAEEK